jgi:hypothetical protein
MTTSEATAICTYEVTFKSKNSEQKKDILKGGRPNFRVASQVWTQVLGRNKRDRRGEMKKGSTGTHRQGAVPPKCHTCHNQTERTPSWLDLALKLGFRTRMPVCRHALSVFSKSGVTFRRRERRDGQQGRFFHNTLFVDRRSRRK